MASSRSFAFSAAWPLPRPSVAVSDSASPARAPALGPGLPPHLPLGCFFPDVYSRYLSSGCSDLRRPRTPSSPSMSGLVWVAHRPPASLPPGRGVDEAARCRGRDGGAVSRPRPPVFSACGRELLGGAWLWAQARRGLRGAGQLRASPGGHGAWSLPPAGPLRRSEVGGRFAAAVPSAHPRFPSFSPFPLLRTLCALRRLSGPCLPLLGVQVWSWDTWISVVVKP